MKKGNIIALTTANQQPHPIVQDQTISKELETAIRELIQQMRDSGPLSKSTY
jgi:hypothetical protein